jgi:hypothetical protein
LHPGARAKLKRVRALLRMPPPLSPAEQAAWAPPARTSQSNPVATPQADVLKPAPLRCPHCGIKLVMIGQWRPEQCLRASLPAVQRTVRPP